MWLELENDASLPGFVSTMTSRCKPALAADCQGSARAGDHLDTAVASAFLARSDLLDDNLECPPAVCCFGRAGKNGWGGVGCPTGNRKEHACSFRGGTPFDRCPDMPLHTSKALATSLKLEAESLFGSPGPLVSHKSEPGTEMVDPEPCFKNEEGGFPQLLMARGLSALQLPGFLILTARLSPGAALGHAASGAAVRQRGGRAQRSPAGALSGRCGQVGHLTRESYLKKKHGEDASHNFWVGKKPFSSWTFEGVGDIPNFASTRAHCLFAKKLSR